MRQAATIRDVARVASLSVASVSRVLNGHENVHADTREKVLSAVRALGYTPNAAARSLSTARTHAIGVVLPDLHGEFFSELVRGMDRAAGAAGYLLLLSNMHADPVLAKQALAAMRGRVDGLIVMAPQLAPDALAEALPAALPALLVNCPDDPRHPALRIDNRAGMRAMVRHLLDLGRKDIVHFAGVPGNLDGDERRAAFTEAMAEFAPGLPARVLDGDFSDASGETLARALLADGHKVDAVLAANDMMALGALFALREAGIAVPGDIAVTGFDDVPLSRWLGLTTVRVDMVGIGERAVARLVAAMSGGGADCAVERQVPELVQRATTAETAG